MVTHGLGTFIMYQDTLDRTCIRECFFGGKVRQDLVPRQEVQERRACQGRGGPWCQGLGRRRAQDTDTIGCAGCHGKLVAWQVCALRHN